jgi:hypothetical protein
VLAPALASPQVRAYRKAHGLAVAEASPGSGTGTSADAAFSSGSEADTRRAGAGAGAGGRASSGGPSPGPTGSQSKPGAGGGVRSGDLLHISSTCDLGGALLELEYAAAAAQRQRAARRSRSSDPSGPGGRQPDLAALLSGTRRGSSTAYFATASLKAEARQEARRVKFAGPGAEEWGDDGFATEKDDQGDGPRFLALGPDGQLVVQASRQTPEEVKAAMVSAAVTTHASSEQARLKKRSIALRQLAAAQKHVARTPERFLGSSEVRSADLAGHLFKGKLV